MIWYHNMYVCACMRVMSPSRLILVRIVIPTVLHMCTLTVAVTSPWRWCARMMVLVWIAGCVTCDPGLGTGEPGWELHRYLSGSVDLNRLVIKVRSEDTHFHKHSRIRFIMNLFLSVRGVLHESQLMSPSAIRAASRTTIVLYLHCSSRTNVDKQII